MDWAARWAGRIGKRPWSDPPLLAGDWRDLEGQDGLPVLMRLRPALELLLPGAEIDAFAVQRLRATDLPFYRGCRLVDLQLQRPSSRLN